MKTCKQCSETKARESFYRSAKSKDGLSFYCRDCSRSRRRKYRTENPDKVREQGRAAGIRRRQRVAQMETLFIDWRDRHTLSHSPCFVCGAPSSFGRTAKKTTWDHIIPISKGGRHSAGNLMTLCLACNVSKGDRFFAEWRIRVLRIPPILTAERAVHRRHPTWCAPAPYRLTT